MLQQNFNQDELFRLVNYPSLDAYLASIGKDEDEAIRAAENTLMEFHAILEYRMNELNYHKLRKEFKVTLQTKDRDALHDYSTPEAAKILGRTPASVRVYINSGRLKGYRTLNGDYRISKESLEAFIISMRNGS